MALRQQKLAAPDLLVAECANILWKKVRRGELTDLEAVTRLAIALDHPPNTASTSLLQAPKVGHSPWIGHSPNAPTGSMSARPAA